MIKETMGKLREIITPLHRSTGRDYVGRMTEDKPGHMRSAREYGREFWDGDRDQGYGGYRYDGRWLPVAEQLADAYGLTPRSSVLDIGCGKGFLLHEFTRAVPGIEVAGVDISEYALEHAKPEVRDKLLLHGAQVRLPFEDNQFDLAVSLTTLHNLEIFDLEAALREMQRVARRAWLVVESYRNDRELFNLQCWALTCRSFYTPEAWVWLFERFGYGGDYEFIFFE